MSDPTSNVCASYLTEPPTGKILLTVPGNTEPAVCVMDADRALDLIRRLGDAVGMLEEITG